MNKQNERIINEIIASASMMKDKNSATLIQYTAGLNAAKGYAAQFKDEEIVFKDKKTELVLSAQNDILSGSKAFSGKLQELTSKLRTNLRESLSAPLNSAFERQLKTISDFGIIPDREQAEALIELNGGNLTGLCALKAVFGKSNVGYTVSFRSPQEYSEDLARLETTASTFAAEPYIPEEFSNAGSDVFSNMPIDYVRKDGSTYQTGEKYTLLQLMLIRSVLTETMKHIETVKKSWSGEEEGRLIDSAQVTASSNQASA